MIQRDSKILLVEDEEEVLSLVQEILEQRGFSSDAAQDGEAAIALMNRQQYDLVLTDWTMPRKSGLEVLIEAKTRWEDCVVIVLTGHASLESTIQSLKQGANDYIRKPFNVDELINTIEVHLHRQFLQRENKRLQIQTEKDRIQLRRKVAELDILRRLSIELSYEFNFSQIFSLIHETLLLALSFDFCASLDLKKYQITIHSLIPVEERIIVWIRDHFTETLAKHDTRVYADRLSVTQKSSVSGIPVHEIPQTSEFIVMRDETTVYGVLMVARFEGESFTDEDSGFLRDVARQVSEVFGRLKGVMESQRSKLQFIVDSLPDGIIVYEPQGDSIIVNPMARRMIDRRGSRTITRKDIEYRMNVEMKELGAQVEEAGGPIIMQFSLDNVSSRTILDANVANLATTDGLPSGLIMVFRDVTRERTLDQMKKEFISNVHHELRTPAAIIKEFLALLYEQIGGPLNAKQREYVETMQRNMERLLRLIENLLFSSRMDLNEMKLVKERTDILAIVRNIGNEYLVRLAQKQIRLKTRFPRPPVEGDVDSDALIQILANLMDNAMKFTPKGGAVTLGLRKKNDGLLFFISDTGPGIAPQHMDRIFDRFYRIESNEEARREGIGLGLPIVKELVLKHNGSIWLESRVNEGATFFVRIPYGAAVGGTGV